MAFRIRLHGIRIRILTWLLSGFSLCPSGTALAQPISSHPRWSNPSPHGNQIFAMAYSETLQRAVQVTERGLLYFSDDLIQWTPRESGTDIALRSALFLPNGRLVCVGERGSVFYSDDLDATNLFAPGKLLDGPTDDWLESVTASPTGLIAVGDNGAIYASQDGSRWKRMATPFTTWLDGVAYGPPGFVAVGTAGAIFFSTDGTNWDSHPTGTKDWLSVTFGSGQYLASGKNGAIGISTNGTDWTLDNTGRTNDLWTASIQGGSRLLGGVYELLISETNGPWVDQLTLSSNAAPVGTYYSVLPRSHYFLAGGRNGILAEGYQSGDGFPYAWTETSPSLRPWLWSVTQVSGLYVAVGQRGSIMTSDNGADWSLELVPDSVTNSTFLGIGGDTNVLIAVGTGGALIRSVNSVVQTPEGLTNGSTFGVVWEPILPRPTTNQLQGVAAGHGLYLVVGDHGDIASSTDGLTWTLQTTDNTNLLSGVSASDTGFFACGQNGTLLSSGPTGDNWQILNVPTQKWLFRVRSHGAQSLAIGEAGTLLTSEDGSTWQLQNSGTAEFLTDAVWVQNTWYVVGQSGTLLWSTNSTDWKVLSTFTYRDLYGLAAEQDQLVMVGEEGAILRDQVIPNLAPMEILQFAQSKDAAQDTVSDLLLIGGRLDQRFILEWVDQTDWKTWTTGPFLEITDSSGVITFLVTRPSTNSPPKRFYRTRLVP